MKYIFRYERCNNLSLSNLRHGEFFFASSEELNDPSEGTPVFVLKGDLELWKRLCEYLLFYHKFSNLFPLFQSKLPEFAVEIKRRAGSKPITIIEFQNLFDSVFLDIFQHESDSHSGLAKYHSYLPSIFEQNIIEVLRHSKQNIVSFSLNASNPTMWSHYADSYKGFCTIFKPKDNHIVLKGLNHLFPLEEVTEFPLLRRGSGERKIKIEEVIYRNIPPTQNAFHQLSSKFYYSSEEDHYDVPLTITSKAPNYEEKKVGLIKYTEWRYEREVRLLIPFASNFHSEFSNLPESRIATYHPQHFHGVILGPLMNRRDKYRVFHALHSMKRMTHTKFDLNPKYIASSLVFQAVQHPAKYKLEIQPLCKIEFNEYSFNLTSFASLSSKEKEEFERDAESFKEH